MDVRNMTRQTEIGEEEEEQKRNENLQSSQKRVKNILLSEEADEMIVTTNRHALSQHQLKPKAAFSNKEKDPLSQADNISRSSLEISMNSSVMALMTSSFSKMRKRLFSPVAKNMPDGISERSLESSPTI